MNRWGGSATLLILLFLAPAVAAIETSRIQTIASKTEVRVGEDFTVSLMIEPTEPITGVEIILSFNPEILNLIDVRYQGLLGPNSFHIPAKIDQENGRVLMAGTTLNGITVSSSGNFVKLTFAAKKVGYSDLKIVSAKLVRAENSAEGSTIVPVSCNVENARVKVTEVKSAALGGGTLGGGTRLSSAYRSEEIIIPLAGGILLLLALFIALLAIRRAKYWPEETYFW